jgi:hypothetical protein
MFCYMFWNKHLARAREKNALFSAVSNGTSAPMERASMPGPARPLPTLQLPVRSGRAAPEPQRAPQDSDSDSDVGAPNLVSDSDDDVPPLFDCDSDEEEEAEDAARAVAARAVAARAETPPSGERAPPAPCPPAPTKLRTRLACQLKF